MVERETVLLKKIEINVAESEKRSGKNTVNMHETYTVYLIEIRWVALRSVSLGAAVAQEVERVDRRVAGWIPGSS